MIIKNPRLLIKLFGLLALIAGSPLVNSASVNTLHMVTLAWDVNPEIDVSGYKVYMGTVSQQYSQTLDAGANTTLLVGSLEFGTTYYFAVSAINNASVESDLSSELVVTVAPPPLPMVAGILKSGSGQMGLNWSFLKTALGTLPEFVVSASQDLKVWTEVATIYLEQATGEDSQSLQFSWPIVVSGPRMFYRLTAMNWMGASTTP
jgi:fibronectin type 3 domain-containing protein